MRCHRGADGVVERVDDIAACVVARRRRRSAADTGRCGSRGRRVQVGEQARAVEGRRSDRRHGGWTRLVTMVRRRWMVLMMWAADDVRRRHRCRRHVRRSRRRRMVESGLVVMVSHRTGRGARMRRSLQLVRTVMVDNVVSGWDVVRHGWAV